MSTEDRIQKQKDLVEKIGRHFDREGFQPIAGRIIGLLMVMDKEQYTFDEITEELHISKSSASNVLRNLEIREMIEYITIPGDRKKYYRLRQQNAFELIDEFERKSKFVTELLQEVICLKADKNSTNAQLFANVIDILEFYHENLKVLREKYIKS
ncbi:MAG: hypothetical protein JW894_05460 [Bacteroidales bacterium]|nr:hypothetical protein [Bacteroidales bacterium]